MPSGVLLSENPYKNIGLTLFNSFFLSGGKGWVEPGTAPVNTPLPMSLDKIIYFFNVCNKINITQGVVNQNNTCVRCKSKARVGTGLIKNNKSILT